jgi:hypothetical protein
MTNAHQGKRWTPEEDGRLARLFHHRFPKDQSDEDAIRSAEGIFGRSRGAIESRLIKLGLLDRLYYVRRYKLNR